MDAPRPTPPPPRPPGPPRHFRPIRPRQNHPWVENTRAISLAQAGTYATGNSLEESAEIWESGHCCEGDTNQLDDDENHERGRRERFPFFRGYLTGWG
jgi:hypothetical protein